MQPKAFIVNKFGNNISCFSRSVDKNFQSGYTLCMVLNGIDAIDGFDSLFARKKLGVITSVSGVNREFVPSWKILAERYTVGALFAPEHGLFGCEEAGAPVESGGSQSASGIPVYSLYRKDGQDFESSTLEHVDALVYDIQDVGTRFYTYISTMICALKAACTYGKEVIILDRVNPLGGFKAEGALVQKEYESFVGMYPLPIRYALTAGELARFVHASEAMSCELHTVPVKNWTRGMLFNETGLPWVPPSPNIPRFECALLYPGIGLFEGTNISEGRGTASPFSTVGAPFIDAEKLADAMNAKKLPGVHFMNTCFTPVSSKHSGTLCRGVRLFITDCKTFEPVKTGLELLFTIKNEYPEDFTFLPVPVGAKLMPVDRLAGSSILRRASSAREVAAVFEKEADAFFKRVKKFFMYGDVL